MQFGGINYDEQSYTFLEGGELLEEGEYYILMPSAIEEGGDIEVAEPNRIIHIDKYNDMNNQEINNLLEKYKTAYKNEIVPTKDNDGIELIRYKSKYDFLDE